MVYRSFILIAAIALAACGGGSRREAARAQAPDMHTAELALDYTGVYTGTFPAADAPGIEITLDLRKDGTYRMRSHYIDRSTFRTEGAYRVEGNLLTLQPADGGAPEYYHVGENVLTRLDGDKQEIRGALASHYKLTKEK